ncbi:hypothetical protein GCM10028822_13550 [Hymenobacter terrigena]
MDTAILPTTQGRTTLYHRRHAWQQRVKTLSHLGPALVLLFAVQPVLAGNEAFTPLVALEFGVGAAYLVLMVRELLHLRHNPFHQERVAWLELAAAGILALESYHIWHRHHVAEAAQGVHRLHTLPWIYAAVAVAYVVMAFRTRQMAGRRFLHLHPAGFGVRTTRLGRAHELRWADLAAAEPAGPADVLLRRHDGQTHRISFADLHDGPAHRDRLLAHAAQALAPAPEGA